MVRILAEVLYMTKQIYFSSSEKNKKWVVRILAEVLYDKNIHFIIFKLLALA